jgi:hypothetical protein
MTRPQQRAFLRVLLTLVTAACALLTPSAALAQFNTGAITGIVTDSSGGVLAGATILITNSGTNDSRTVVADAQGRYDAPALSTGTYRVEASLDGFQTRKIDGIQLAVGERARVDVKLSVGQVAETVVVTGQTRVNTETANIGSTIGQTSVANLPINGRDFTLLLATVPGSVQSSNFFQTSINGVPTWFGQSVLVDGIDSGRGDLNGFSNTLGRVDARITRASMDSIQEVQVVEQTYSAEYGQSMGAVINAITKSGTNELHGSLFEYFRNDALDSNDYFSEKRNLGKNTFRMNQFGGNVGGPLKRDKVFFFGNYEGVRQDRGVVLQGLVPTTTFRSTFAPALSSVLAKLPLPNQSSVPTNDPRLGLYATQGLRNLREDTGSFKVDVNLSAADRFSVRYNVNDSKTITPYGLAQDQTAEAPLRTQLLKGTLTHTFSGNTVNELGFGINRNVTYPNGGDMSLPIFNFAFIDGAIAAPGAAQFSQYRAGTNYQFTDTLTFIRGGHALKVGTDIRLNRRNARLDQQDQFVFFSLADFANNAPFQVQRIGHPMLWFSNENYSFFAQDDWRIHSRVTINAGVRYDVSSVSREKNGNLQNFDLQTMTYSPKGEKVQDPDLNNIAPRLGVAWDVTGTKRTVVRAGYGVFYNQELPGIYGSPQINSYPSQTVTVFDALFAGLPLSYPLDPRVFATAPFSSRTVGVIDRNLRTSYAQEFSANVQQDIGFGVVQIGYVGNRLRDIVAGQAVTALNPNRINPFTGVRPNPALGDVMLIGNYPESNYDALQVGFKRALAMGLALNANYTYAVQKDDAIGFLKDYQDPDHPENDYSYGDTDLRHNFSMDFVYNVPTTVMHFLPGRMAEGWQVSGIVQARSGLPVNVTVTGGLFGGSLRPDLVPGVSTKPANYSLPDHQYNPDAFVAPPPGQYGDTPRNYLRAPGFAQFDVSFAKMTRLAGARGLQIRVDVFNLFNRTNFAAPFSGLQRDPLSNSLNSTGSFGQSLQTVGDELGGLIGAGGPRQVQLSARFSF